MHALLDTGFLYALLDQSDQHHATVVEIITDFQGDLLLPTAVLVELTYLLQARLGHNRMRQFIGQFLKQSIHLIAITPIDLIRITQLLDQYADVRLDFVDAVIVAIAERLNIQNILTVDRRDFLIIRPQHCPHFMLLP